MGPVTVNVIVKIASAASGFLVSVTLARVLGVNGFGIYVYVMSWIALLAIPASYGIPQWLLREVSRDSSNSAASIRHLIHWSSMRVGVASICTLVVFLTLVTWLADDERQIYWAFLAALLLIPLNALTDVRVSALHGLNRVVLSQLPRLLLHPILFLILLGFTARNGIGPAAALWLNVAASALVMLASYVLLARVCPSAPTACSESRASVAYGNGTFSFMFIMTVYLVNNRADVLMLGAMSGPASAGAYAAASRIVELVAFVLFGVNTVIAPVIGRAWARGNGPRSSES